MSRNPEYSIRCKYCLQDIPSIEELESHLEECRRSHQYFCYEMKYTYDLNPLTEYPDGTVHLHKIFCSSAEDMERMIGVSECRLQYDQKFVVMSFLPDDYDETIRNMVEAAKSEIKKKLDEIKKEVDSINPRETFLEN